MLKIKEYIKIAERCLQDFINEFGFSNETFVKAVCIGINVPEWKEYLDILFSLDNFLVFKSYMISRNLELNEEAEKALQDTTGSQ